MTYYSASQTTEHGTAEKSQVAVGYYLYTSRTESDNLLLSNQQALQLFADRKLVDGCLVSTKLHETQDGDFHASTVITHKVCDPVAVKAILDQLTK